MVGVFPNETSAATLATAIALRSSEEWALKRYLAMNAFESVKNQTQNFRDIDNKYPPSSFLLSYRHRACSAIIVGAIDTRLTVYEQEICRLYKSIKYKVPNSSESAVIKNPFADSSDGYDLIFSRLIQFFSPPVFSSAAILQNYP